MLYKLNPMYLTHVLIMHLIFNTSTTHGVNENNDSFFSRVILLSIFNKSQGHTHGGNRSC